jgi:hypothetical protein
MITSPAFDFRTRVKEQPLVTTLVAPSVTSRTSTTPVVITSFAQGQIPKEETKTIQEPILTPVTPRMTTPRTPTPTPKQPPFTPPPFALPAMRGFSSRKGGLGRIGAKPKYGYTPSFTALIGGIRGKERKGSLKGGKYSGFEFRPVTSGFLKMTGFVGGKVREVFGTKGTKKRKRKR